MFATPSCTAGIDAFFRALLDLHIITFLVTSVNADRVLKEARSLGSPPAKSKGMNGGELARRWAEVSEHRSNLRAKWTTRLQWVPEDVDVWRSILAVRSLVFKPREVWNSLERWTGEGGLIVAVIGGTVPRSSSSDPSRFVSAS